MIPISAFCIEANRIISPNYASKNNHYKCSKCNKDVVLCKGEIKKPYFRHHSDTDPCNYFNHTNETQQHKDAKELLKFWLDHKYEITIHRKCIRCNQNESFEIPITDDHSKVKMEYKFMHNGTYKWADVCYLDHDEMVCIFEVHYTHKTEPSCRPGIWFELNATSILVHEGNNIQLECIRQDESCEECTKKEKEKNSLRKNATTKLYNWLQEHRIKPFDYFQEDSEYHHTELLDNDYFQIDIYEKDQDKEVLRYKIRLSYEDEQPDFQGIEEKQDYIVIGVYFVDVHWVHAQTSTPDFIRFEHSMDYFKNGYLRECPANNFKCDPNSDCNYNRPLVVKALNVQNQDYKVISVGKWCDIDEGSEYIPCVLCNSYEDMSIMYTNKVSVLYCKNCDIDCFSQQKRYFYVSYSQKDDFKVCGGMWDKNKKKWFVYEKNYNIDTIREKWSEY